MLNTIILKVLVFYICVLSKLESYAHVIKQYSGSICKLLLALRNR